MSKIKSKKLSWVASPDSDVVAYNVYCALGSSVSYDSPKVVVAAPATEYSLPGVFDMSSSADYTLAVSAVDATGNESDLSVSITSFFDVQPPIAPTSLAISDL